MHSQLAHFCRSTAAVPAQHQGWGRAGHCQHLPAPLQDLSRGTQEKPASSASPGTTRRVSQHRGREKTCQVIPCQDIFCLHLLFHQWPMWDLPRLRHDHQTSFWWLRTLLFLSHSIKLPIPSPSHASSAAKVCTNSPALAGSLT